MVHASSDITLLLTRPLYESLEMKRILVHQGYKVLIDPMLEIRALVCPPLILKGVQAFVTTSIHGLRRLGQLTPCRTIPVYVVGEVSAREAYLQGFEIVHAAQGSVSSLVALLQEHLQPLAGKILYLSGQEIKADLVEMLNSNGFISERIVVYEARATQALRSETQESLITSRLNAVLFFSPRTVTIFSRLTVLYRQVFSQMTAICISDEVAALLKRHQWQNILISTERSGRHMIQSVISAFPLKETDNKKDM